MPTVISFDACGTRRALAGVFVTAVLSCTGAQAQTAACVHPALSYTFDNEPVVQPPFVETYPSHGRSDAAGQGSNPTWTGYSVRVATVSGNPALNFGVLHSDTAEGVPWDDDAGLLTDGAVDALGIDVGTTSTYEIVLSFERPVSGLRFAITDLDLASERVLVQAFPTDTSVSPIAVADNLLSNPAVLPELARGTAHGSNDAYVVDSNKVAAQGAGLYSVRTSGGVSDQSGTVLFRFADAQPVQRLEVTYGGSNTGIWIAGMEFIDTPPAEEVFFDDFEECFP